MRTANQKIAQGWDVYQKWTCQHCGARQTMPDRNKFYARGLCEDCKKETNIVARGCNYMATIATDMSKLRNIVAELVREKK